MTTSEVLPHHDIPALNGCYFFSTFVSCIIVFNNPTGLSIRLGILIIHGEIFVVSEHVIMVTQSEIDCKCT